MKNNLSDLNNHLFSMLEELEDDETFEDPAKAERTLKRAKAMTRVSSQILNIARIQVQAIKTAESCGLLNEDMPALIATKDSKAEKFEKQKETRKLLEKACR